MPALGRALVLTSVAMLLKAPRHRLGRHFRTTAPEHFKGWQPALTVAAGALLGCLVTLTSVGAGALGVVTLVYRYPFRLQPPKLVGTDLDHAVPLVLVGGLGHLGLGNGDFPLLGSLLLGSIPGILLGSRLRLKANHNYIRSAIAVMLVLVGARILLQ